MLRFAINATQNININYLQTALFNYIVSKQKNEDLIIRIDDTNKKEDTTNNEKEILEILNLFSIDYKYTVNQSSNIKYHSKFAMQLLIEKKAFNCFCGDEVLQKEKDEAKKMNKQYIYSGFCQNLSDEVTFTCEAPFTVRLIKPNKDIKFNDLLQGECTYKSSLIDSFIILNHDKTPSYDFACAIDDMLSDISTVIRSNDYITNTANQIHLRNSIGYNKELEYIHIQNLSNEDISIQTLINNGYLPAAIANYILTLSYNTPKEIFTIEESIQWFDISKVFKTPKQFDLKQLNKFNNIYLNEMDNLRLSKLLSYSDEDIGSLAKLYLSKYDTIKQLKEKIDIIFSKKDELKELKNECNLVKNCIINSSFIKEFDKFKTYIKKQTNLSNDILEKTLKFVLTGDKDAPALDDIYPLIRNYLGEIV